MSEAEQAADSGEVAEEAAEQITNFAQVARESDSVRVRVRFDDGRNVVFNAQPLTYKRWNELGRMVKNEDPPINGVDSLGRPNYNVHDDTYLKQLAINEEERMYFRLAEFVLLDWGEADTLAKRKTMLEEELEMSVSMALMEAMIQISRDGAGETARARAATFPGE